LAEPLQSARLRVNRKPLEIIRPIILDDEPILARMK
jgi:hypothetical protein